MSSETLGDYRLLGRLGRGGMGEVWLAEDPSGDKVAIKTLRAELADETARFAREVEVLASLDHPGIVRCLSGFEREGQVAYYAMEFVQGRDLAATLASQRKLAPPVAVDLTLRLLEALGAAHQAGVVHRDIKPGNVLVGRNGLPRLTDFGLARCLDATRLTSAGTILGSPAYMSPEQANGEEAGPASDLYSIGVMLFELLTGRLPFVAPTPLGVLRMHADSPPPRLSSLVPDLPEPLVDTVARCLAKDPAERYPSAEELRFALEAALTRHDDSTVFLQACATTLEPVRPEETSFGPPRPEDGGGDTAVAPRRIPALVWILIVTAGVGVVGLVGLMAVMLLFASGAEEPYEFQIDSRSGDMGSQVALRPSPPKQGPGYGAGGDLPDQDPPADPAVTPVPSPSPSPEIVFATGDPDSGRPPRPGSTQKAPGPSLVEARRLVPLALGAGKEEARAARLQLLSLERQAATQAVDEWIAASGVEGYKRSAADDLRLEVDRGLGPFLEAEPRATIPTGMLQFSFSPSGERLLSLREGEKRRYELWLREGDEQRRLCQLPFRGEGAMPGYLGPRTWSADGRRVAVVVGEGKSFRAGWLDVESGRAQAVGTRIGASYEPGFHPARPLLIYLNAPRWRKIGATVYSFDLESGEEREVWTDVRALVRELTISPDGKRAAFFYARQGQKRIKGDNVRLCSLDLETGELQEGPPADVEDFFTNDAPHFYWLDAQRLIHYRTEGHKFPVALETWDVVSDARERVLPPDHWVITTRLDADRVLVRNKRLRTAAVLKVREKQLLLFGQGPILVARSGLRAVSFDFKAKEAKLFDLSR